MVETACTKGGWRGGGGVEGVYGGDYSRLSRGEKHIYRCRADNWKIVVIAGRCDEDNRQLWWG